MEKGKRGKGGDSMTPDQESDLLRRVEALEALLAAKAAPLPQPAIAPAIAPPPPGMIEDAIAGGEKLGLKNAEASTLAHNCYRLEPKSAGELVKLMLNHRTDPAFCLADAGRVVKHDRGAVKAKMPIPVPPVSRAVIHKSIEPMEPRPVKPGKMTRIRKYLLPPRWAGLAWMLEKKP
jgi:hypothetical protein